MQDLTLLNCISFCQLIYEVWNGFILQADKPLYIHYYWLNVYNYWYPNHSNRILPWWPHYILRVSLELFHYSTTKQTRKSFGCEDLILGLLREWTSLSTQRKTHFQLLYRRHFSSTVSTKSRKRSYSFKTSKKIAASNCRGCWLSFKLCGDHDLVL